MPQKSFISILFSPAFNGLLAYFLTDEERTQTGFWDSPKFTEPVRDTTWLTPQVFFLLTQLGDLVLPASNAKKAVLLETRIIVLPQRECSINNEEVSAYTMILSNH